MHDPLHMQLDPQLLRAHRSGYLLRILFLKVDANIHQYRALIMCALPVGYTKCSRIDGTDPVSIASTKWSGTGYILPRISILLSTSQKIEESDYKDGSLRQPPRLACFESPFVCITKFRFAMICLDRSSFDVRCSDVADHFRNDFARQVCISRI